MEMNRAILTLLISMMLYSSLVSARRLAEDADLGTRSPRNSEPFENVLSQEQSQGRLPTHNSEAVYKSLDEIDRLRLSINKLICETMEEDCDQVDDAADHTTTEDHVNESFSTLNPQDHVRDLEY